MTDVNPYSAPDAALDTGTGELYEPSVFTFNGRIGRLRYLAYGIGVMMVLMVVLMPIMGGTAFMTGEAGMSSLGFVLIAVFYIAAIVFSIMFAKRRLNDLNRSGWWFLVSFVPIANLFLTIYMIFFPGTDGSNNFGPAPVENSIGVKILGWMLPLVFLVGIAAAIAIPAYMQYTGGQ